MERTRSDGSAENEKENQDESLQDLSGCCLGNTRNGTPIVIYDRKGIQQDEAAPDMSFEAAWGADGALCVSHTRIPDVLTMEGLAANCPGVRQQPRTACESRAGALILNRSIDRRTVQAATEQSFRGRSAGLIGVRMFQMFKRMR